MNALELTQRQRELLGNIAKAANEYRQAVTDASARLEHELEQIEQSRRQERQRIEEEREEKAKTKIDRLLAGIKEGQREKTEQRLQQKIAARRSTITLPTGITTIEAVKGEINRTLSARPRAGAIGIIGLILLLGGGVVLMWVVCSALFSDLQVNSNPVAFLKDVGIVFVVGITILRLLIETSEKASFVNSVNRIAYLHSLYDRWLELVDEQASAQRAEAQRRYEQAVAQAKGQMLAAVEQSRPAIAEFGALTEQIFPSWESEAWRRWEPGRLGPGAVRLGVFKMEV